MARWRFIPRVRDEPHQIMNKEIEDESDW